MKRAYRAASARSSRGAATGDAAGASARSASSRSYISATRGFKSGVVNIGSINSVIDPEYVWSYEAGFRGETADRKFGFAGAVFYYDYSNLQVGFVNAGLPGQVGGDKTVGAIQAIGHGVFAAHGAVVALLFFGFGFGGDRHTGDAVFLRHNRVD